MDMNIHLAVPTENAGTIKR